MSSSASSRMTPPRPWLLWDGTCGLCCWSVHRAISRGADRYFRVVPYQDAPTPPMTGDLTRRAARAVQVLGPDGLHLEAGRACLYVLETVGWGVAARILGVPPLVWLVEGVYWLIARNRRFLSRFLSRDPGKCPH